jgi:hypothetical protein
MMLANMGQYGGYVGVDIRTAHQAVRLGIPMQVGNLNNA